MTKIENKEEFIEHFVNVTVLEDDEEDDINQSLSEYQLNRLNKIFKNDFLNKQKKDKQ